MNERAAMSSPALPTREQIAARAYQLFLEHGRLHGHDKDDWLQAEYELTRLPVRKIAELKSPIPHKPWASALVAAVRAALILGPAALCQFRVQ